MSWTDRSSNETGFRVKRSLDGGSTWTTAATVGANVTAYQDGGRGAEQQVCYRVVAFNAVGTSSSNTDCTTPPAAPTNLASSAAAQGGINLTWVDNSAAEDGYQVQRSMDGTTYSTIASLAANTKSYADAAATSNTTYWYRVRASKDGGFSDFSTPTAAVSATTIPAAPTLVSASPLNGSWTDIIWRDNATNEAGIRVERSRAGGPWATISSGGPTTEGVSRLLRDSEPYPIETEICYRIVAFNGVGESSDTGCTALPALPLDLTARVVDGAVELSWTDVSRFEDGFYIVRADGISMGFYYVYDAVGANATTYRDLNPDPAWSSYYLRGMKGPDGYSCCSNAVDVYMPAPE